jgi:hypothetical protein
VSSRPVPLASRFVTFEETGERREVTRRCETCGRSIIGGWESHPGFGVVSITGVEHVGVDYGRTACGKDADGPSWWWPL